MKKLILITGIFILFFYGIQAEEVTRGQLMQLFYLAQKYQKAGNNEGAIQSYKKIVELAPKLPEPYLALGFLYSANDDDKSSKLALQFYRKYIELAPQNVERDSIAHIVSAMEQYIGAPENNIDNDTIIESITENISNNNKSNYNPHEPIISKPENTNQREKGLFDGKWISDRFVKSTMIPEWVFDISGSGNAYKISFHHASQRYSDNLDSKVKDAVYVNDTCLFVRFVLSDAGKKDDNSDQRETTEELTLTLLSKYALNLKCKETTKVQRFGESPMVGEDAFETLFHKIPDDKDMTFVMLGKDNYLITNYPATDEHPYKTTKSLIKDYKKQVKKQTSGTITDKDLYNHLAGIDSLGYCQWYSKKETKSLLKTIGNGLIDIATATVSAITTNQFSVVGTFGGMVVQWLKDSSSPQSADSSSIINNKINSTLKVNPLEWNVKMYKSLLDYYMNNKNVNIQTAH